MKLVRRQRPIAETIHYLQKEKETQEKHRDFRKEKESMKQNRRLQAMSKAERRRELARIQREKRLAAEEATVEQEETVQNPMAGSPPRLGGSDTGTDGMETPKKVFPDGLSVQIPGSENLADGDGASALKHETKKQRQKREKKLAKENKKLQKMNGQRGDGAGSRPAPPPVAPRVDGQSSHSAALSLISGDASEQIADLESLGELEALGDIGGDVV
jgi:hypothetical protein